MKICGLASGECGISISWLGTGLGGPKRSRLTLPLTLPLTSPAEPEEGNPSGIRFLEYEEEPGDRVAATDT
jgi:hypothetical protein